MKKLIVFATICAMSAVWADDDKSKTAKKPAPTGMMPPKPRPEMKELAWLVGSWRSSDKMEAAMGMPGGQGTSMETYTLGPGGLSLVLHVSGTSGPMSGFHGLGIFTWSPEEKAYKMVWTDSMSPGITTQTGHKEGDTIVMQGEMVMDGKKYKSRDVLSDMTPTSFTMTSYNDDGTGEKLMMTLKLKKEAAKPKTEAPK